jgi:3-oxoacyl-(acyl-carrier-protein) synthase
MYMCFLEDAGAVAERRLPPVQRSGRWHHARRRARHGRAQAARRCRARRRPHLRGAARHRHRFRRPCEVGLRAGRGRAGAQAWRRAYESAGYGPETVELLEAHGTGTKAGDIAEFEGLRQVFANGGGQNARQWCALGSVKSQIGHTKAAAGAAGLFKAVMALAPQGAAADDQGRSAEPETRDRTTARSI